MSGRVTDLWRYPVKSHGREQMQQLTLTAGQTIPWDRTWAVAHDQSSVDGSEWAPCQNFSIGTKAPGLAAMTAALDEETSQVTLSHPALGTLTFDPDQEGDRLIAWAGGLIPENRAQSARVVRGKVRGFTDTPFASVSLINLASHKAVESRLGRALERERWRGNIWLDGFDVWEEFDWIGKKLRIGNAEVEIKERVVRCLHTTASPKTGTRDTDTLSVLSDAWGHQDFGVYAEVITSGAVALGDSAEVI